MNYVKPQDTDNGIVIVKEEVCLEFEEVEFDDYKPEEFGAKVIELFGLQNVSADTNGPKVPTYQNDRESSQIIIKEEIELGDKVIELFGLQNVSAGTNGPKVPTCQNDRESSQIIIKEEIDCDIGDVSVSEFDSLCFADEVTGPILRRSSRKRCPRFSLDDLLENSSDEAAVDERRNKVRIRSSSRSSCDGARVPGGGNGSDRAAVRGKFFETFCDICGRGFTRLGYLRRHVATHAGPERPKRHECGVCKKCFSRSDNLKDHERLHRGERFRCAVCDREFSQVSHLTQHARTHTGERPFGCADCGKAFRVRGSLLDHVRIHTGERPFACRACGKSFRQAAHLRDHARLHTGERRHACKVCGRRFFRRSHLKVHACGPARRCRKREQVRR